MSNAMETGKIIPEGVSEEDRVITFTQEEQGLKEVVDRARKILDRFNEAKKAHDLNGMVVASMKFVLSTEGIKFIFKNKEVFDSLIAKERKLYETSPEKIRKEHEKCINDIVIAMEKLDATKEELSVKVNTLEKFQRTHNIADYQI